MERIPRRHIHSTLSPGHVWKKLKKPPLVREGKGKKYLSSYGVGKKKMGEGEKIRVTKGNGFLTTKDKEGGGWLQLSPQIHREKTKPFSVQLRRKKKNKNPTPQGSHLKSLTNNREGLDDGKISVPGRPKGHGPVHLKRKIDSSDKKTEKSSSPVGTNRGEGKRTRDRQKNGNLEDPKLQD